MIRFKTKGTQLTKNSLLLGLARHTGLSASVEQEVDANPYDGTGVRYTHTV